MKSTIIAVSAIVLTATVATAISAQSGPKDRSDDLAWQNAQQLALASRQASDGWRWMEGGLLWRRVKGDGSGEHPTVQDTVTVHYRGTFVDGAEFDSSYKRGDPATFPLGGLVKAWQMAIPQMGVGDTIEIAVPASLGYGAAGRGPIPGGATLLFTIELIDVAE